MTAQVHERLIYEGERMSMAYCPPLPEGDPRLQMRSAAEMQHCDPVIFSTACWRGYIATWAIREGRLYLVDIAGRYKLASEEPIFADWVSGVLRVPRGKVARYAHMGFATVYESELHITVEKGQVVAVNLVEHGDQHPSPDQWGHVF